MSSAHPGRILPQDVVPQDGSGDMLTALPFSQSEVDELLYGDDRPPQERIERLQELAGQLREQEPGDFGDGDPRALLGEIDRAARISGAPFLNPDIPLASARTQWSHAFEVLIRMAALEAALSAAKGELTESSDTSAFMRLKGERDALKRAIRTGTVWTAAGSIG